MRNFQVLAHTLFKAACCVYSSFTLQYANFLPTHSLTSIRTQAPVQGELRSPRDISMDSSATEEVLGFKFAAVDSVLLASLSVS